MQLGALISQANVQYARQGQQYWLYDNASLKALQIRGHLQGEA